MRQTVVKAKISVSDCTYTGMDRMPAVSVSLNGKTLKAGTDYKMRYTNNVNIGTATVTVTGMGIYAGEKSAKFDILPPKAALKNVVNSGKDILVMWTEDTSGNYFYQIQRADDRSFRTIIDKKQVLGTNSCPISNRQLNNTAVRIRAGFNVNGKDYFSDWTTW